MVYLAFGYNIFSKTWLFIFTIPILILFFNLKSLKKQSTQKPAPIKNSNTAEQDAAANP